MARTSDPHSATVKAWATRARNASGGGVVQQRTDWTGDDKKLLDQWGTGADIFEKGRNPTTAIGKQMTRALKRLPIYRGTIHRGMGLRPSDLRKLTVGSDFIVRKHSSASKSEDVADLFMVAAPKGQRVLFTIDGAGRDYSTTPTGKHLRQKEVVLMAGTKLRIVSATRIIRRNPEFIVNREVEYLHVVARQVRG